MLFRSRLDGSDRTQLNDLRTQDIVVTDDWIYFYGEENNQGKLMRVHQNGSEQSVVDNSTAMAINVSSDWIIYNQVRDWSKRDVPTYRIKTDGTKKEVIIEELSDWLNVTADWIYFALGDYNGGPLYRAKHDGSQRELLSSETSAWINIVGDWLYCLKGYGSPILVRMRLDGSERAELVGGMWNNVTFE